MQEDWVCKGFQFFPSYHIFFYGTWLHVVHKSTGAVTHIIKFVQQRRKYKHQSNHTENEDTFLSSFVGHANVEHVSHIFTSLIISYSYRHMLQLLQCPYIVASTQPNQYGFWSLIWHAEKAALDIDRGYPPIVLHLEKQIVQCRYKTTPRNIYYEVDSISYTYQLTTTN